jgi:hypothetical protein
MVRQNEHRDASWLKYILIALICEKIIQHVAVTLALYFNWKDIGSTVAVNPGVLMIVGGVLAALFVVALGGMLDRRAWARDVVIALALVDMLGEFVAQGRIGIVINVSFLVASILLILMLLYRRQAPRKA